MVTLLKPHHYVKKNHLFTAVCIFITYALTAQFTYSFTNAGAAGSIGPNQLQINTAYSSSNLSGSVVVTGGIQSFTIPTAGSYKIEAYGAAGGTQLYSPSYPGGPGAYMSGVFSFSAGTVLKILVGQKGNDTQGFPVDNAAPGGGGGTFVYFNASDPLPLIAAGGGGGGGRDQGLLSATTASNGNPALVGGAGGTSGNGGQSNSGGSSYWAGAGAGWLTDGTGGNNSSTYSYFAGSSGAYGGRTPLNGGAGGIRWNDGTDEGGDGGFGGGGGGGSDNMGTGGGGGFSGGGGGRSGASGNPTGGGGGSYNGGASQVNTASVNPGHGKVIITKLNGVAITQLAPITCNGGSNAVLTVSASTGVAPFTYSWLPGGSTSQTITGLSAGSYTCITTDATATSFTNIFTISNPPVITSLITSQTNLTCNGGSNGYLSVSASGGVSPYTYTWSPNGGNSASAFGLTAGLYTCSISDANNCIITTTANLTQPGPINIVAFATSSAICMGGTVSLIGGGANSYTWTNGVINGVPFTPTVTSSYIVTGFDFSGCPGYAQTSVIVNPLPIVAATGAGSVCSGSSTTLSASGASTYSWSNGATGANAIVSPTVATIYTAYGTSSLGCTKTATVSVGAYPLPNVTAVLSNTAICAGGSVIMIGIGANTFSWTGGVVNGLAYFPTSTDVYTVTGTDFNGCSNTATRTVVVNVLPTVSINGSNSICLGDQTLLVASGANSYTWNTSVVSSSISVSPVSSSIYTVTGVSQQGCINTAVYGVTVNPVPALTIITSNTVICEGSSLILTANGAATYTWQPLNVSTTSIVISPNITGNYSLTGSANGCTNSAQITISVNPTPTITVSSQGTICAFDSATLSASGANSYTWETGSNSQNIVVNPPATTTYTLVGSDLNGCSKTGSITQYVNPLPIISIISSDSLICSGDSVMLSVNGANSYTWNTAQNDSVITVKPTTSTTYSVNGTNSYGCINASDYLVNVSPCTGLPEQKALLNNISIYPNPNNGEFTIHSQSDMDLILLNSLGQVIRTFKLDNATNYFTNVKNLTHGIYFLRSANQQHTFNQKIIVSN